MADSVQHPEAPYWRATLTFVFFLASFAVPPQSRAQTFKVLHTRIPTEAGVRPRFTFSVLYRIAVTGETRAKGLLVRDAAGNLYGTTEGGGFVLWYRFQTGHHWERDCPA